MFVTLDDQNRVKDAHAIIWREYAPITTYNNLKDLLLDYLFLQKIYNFFCKTFSVSYNDV